MKKSRNNCIRLGDTEGDMPQKLPTRITREDVESVIGKAPQMRPCASEATAWVTCMAQGKESECRVRFHIILSHELSFRFISSLYIFLSFAVCHSLHLDSLSPFL